MQKEKNFAPAPEKYFRLSNGAVIKDISELQVALKKMETSVFAYHVTPEKNDFSSWVKDVFKDEILAKKLSRSKTQKEMFAHVKRRLDEKFMDAMLADIVALRNSQKIKSDLYPRNRILNHLKKIHENE